MRGARLGGAWAVLVARDDARHDGLERVSFGGGERLPALGPRPTSRCKTAFGPTKGCPAPNELGHPRHVSCRRHVQRVSRAGYCEELVSRAVRPALEGRMRARCAPAEHRTCVAPTK